MAYQTGSAADATALLNAITAFAASNGWTWDATNSMLSKGAVFGKLTTPTSTSLRIQGATGYAGATLTNPTASYAEIRDLANGATVTKTIVWPLTYHLFVNTAPDDLVCLINFDTSYWEWLGLGQCTDLGVGAGGGTAAWCGASMPALALNRILIAANGYAASSYGDNRAPCAPFWAQSVYFATASSWLHCALDGSDGVVRQWACDADALIGLFFRAFTPLLERQPNAWNAETVLVPARIAVSRPSSLWSYAAEMPHARLLKIDNYDGGDLITLGSDTWFVAPFFRKNAAAQTAADTGVWGWAIRKTA